MTNIPKLKFEVASPEKTFPLIHSFLNPNKNEPDWSDAIYSHYPKLKNEIRDIKNKKARRIKEHKYFEKVFNREKLRLEKTCIDFQNEWNKINNEIVIALSEAVEQDRSQKDKLLIARITLNPICPRFLKKRMFDVFYRQETNYMKSVAIHEIFHFLYFEKWKKLFPKTKIKEFEAPYLAWQLSEMIPGVVLNDSRIQKVFKYKFRSYEEYEDFKINDRPLMYCLQEFYDGRKDFEDFSRKLWQFVRECEKEIDKIWK